MRLARATSQGAALLGKKSMGFGVFDASGAE